MSKLSLRRLGLSLLAGVMIIPSAVWATDDVQVNQLILQGPNAYLQQQGSKPVKIKDNLKVLGNITLSVGKTVDGVDLGNLADIVTGLQTSSVYSAGSGLSLTDHTFSLTDSCTTNQILKFDGTSWNCASDQNTAYTAGTGISISGTSISANLASSNLSDASNVALLGDAETITGNWVNTTNPWADNEVANDLTMDGGRIDNSPIGANTPSTGDFTNITLNGVSSVLPAMPSIPRAATNTVIDSTSNYIGGGVSTTIGTDGLPVISYIDLTNRYLKFAHCEDVTCTTATLSTLSTDASNYSAIIIDADGNPAIAYDRYNTDGLMLVKCGNSDCTSGNTTNTVDTVDADAPSITIGTDGLPVIAYVNRDANTLKVAKCGNATCSSGNTITTLDSADIVNFSPVTIAVAPDGYPVIAYHHYAPDYDLIVAKCTTVSCSSSGTQTLDSTNAVGLYNAMVIGADGLPVISYYDDTNDNLMIAKCGNSTCTNGAATITTVDSTGDVGPGNSITLAPDGLPLVTYMDVTNGYIKLLKCGDAACSAHNTITAALNLHNTTFSIVHQLSLTLGRDNLPFVAYLDQSGLDLRTEAFGSLYGTNYFVRR